MAISLYTYDLGPSLRDKNPYVLINKPLVERTVLMMQKWCEVLFLLLSGLRKLPRVKYEQLYRGIHTKVNTDSKHYATGNTVVWHALSSTSPNLQATELFVTGGTLFMIYNAWD
ncbi:hypothetical protein Pelo_15827 [Pelomyxa schiedti]|nr:hypothetical protein Pelo_15827 [Pelomyxa schiedti]